MNQESYPAPRIPVSTYRLQFNGGFGFAAARQVIPYLDELGITDIYASPYLKARHGSPHGYDIVEPGRLNPEIGSEEEFDAMAVELKTRDMGQLMDIVPNHMGIGTENPWWMDVLENGPASLYAKFFDINWEPVKRELKNKVLLPILGAQYGRVLEDGELALAFKRGAFFVCYHEHKLPVMPDTYIHIISHRLDALPLPADSPHLIELLSITTVLSNLPPYTDTDAEKLVERAREKEVIKHRLNDLYGACSEIREFIEGNLATFNGSGLSSQVQQARICRNLGGCPVVQRFSWSVVNLINDAIQLLLRYCVEVDPLRKVLPQQPVEVFVLAALP